MNDDTASTAGFAQSEFQALHGSTGVLALTDDGTEEILGAVREVAARLATALDTTLYLADRSTRTWTESPHVRGPITVDEMREVGIGYMVKQMEEAMVLGVRDVRGLAPSIPTFDALRDSIESTGAEVVVTPSGLEHLRLFDRLQISGDLAATVKDVVGERHVVTVDKDGSITVN